MAVIGGPVDIGFSVRGQGDGTAVVASAAGPAEPADEPVDDGAASEGADEEQVVWDEPADGEPADGDESEDPTTSAPRRSSSSASAADADEPSSSSDDEPASTTATTAKRRSAPATTAAPKPTSPPTTKAPPPPPSPKYSEEGEASWYQYIDGTCAHKTIAKGTIVTVTNVQNGKTTTCRVADRGPYGPGRIIDLDKEVFEQLAPASQGVFPARITWS